MRADLYLVSNGYYESRDRAQAAIKAGLVKVDGKRLKKASEKLSDMNEISTKAEHPWVSRGGLKLAYALKEFKVSAEGKTCLDVGASTGGFSDVLRQQGAARVYAVDVGHGQLHASLQSVPEIISMEGQDARELTAAHFSTKPQLIVCDASFISCMKVLERPLTLAGLVKSESLALQALSDVSAWVTAQGWHVVATCRSPIKGGSGNTEYLLHARK